MKHGNGGLKCFLSLSMIFVLTSLTFPIVTTASPLAPVNSWNALGDGLNNYVYVTATCGSDVYVGGSFVNAGGIDAADYLARWDGSAWHTVGSGLGGAVKSVSAITIVGHDIY